MKFATIIADPMYPLSELVLNFPAHELACENSHLYLWVRSPRSLPESLQVMENWGFKYKTQLVCLTVGDDGCPKGYFADGFRCATETILLGVRGKLRTLQPGRRQVNLFKVRNSEERRKEFVRIVGGCSPGPHVHLFCVEQYCKDWASYEKT